MRSDAMLAFLLLYTQGVLTIRIVDLRVPDYAPAGGEALLRCHFDMEDDLLYSVKWYKDDREFYRYIPHSATPALHFDRPGVTVDMSRSSSDAVTLVNLKPESAGQYRCEVSGERPHFVTVGDQKFINIHIIPKSVPRITGLKFQYNIGDKLKANCSVPGSRPEAQLKWIVNGKEVSRAYIRGPWRRVVDGPPQTTETTIGLNFMVVPRHYKKGVLEIKCRATIAPLYQREKVFVLTQPEPESSPEEPEVHVQAPKTPEPVLIPEFPDNTPTFKDEEIHEKLLHSFRELENTLHLEVPNLTPSYTNLREESPIETPSYTNLREESPIETISTTDAPQNGNAKKNYTEKTVLLVLLSLLMQVILL